MTKHPNIAPEKVRALQEALAALAEGMRIVSVYLYGSRARGEATEGSDYDIAVFLGDDAETTDDRARRELGMCELLEKTTGLKGVDVRILDRAPLMVKGKVLTEGVLLFVGDEEARVRMERDTRIRYFEFSLKMEGLDRDLLRRVAEEGIFGGGSE